MACAAVVQEPAKRLRADETLAQQRVPIAIGAQLTSTVVQVKKRRRLAHGLLEFIENRGEGRLRFGNVVAGCPEVAGIEAITCALSQLRGNVSQNLRNLRGSPTHGASRARRVLHQDAGLAVDGLQGRGDGQSDALQRERDITARGRSRMEAELAGTQRAATLELLREAR